MPTLARFAEIRREIIARHAKPDNRHAWAQVLATLLPLAALWYAALLSVTVWYWFTAGVILMMSLFLLRSFVLMHDCGHGSLFRSRRLNRICGFVFGVMSGMPQYVWSRHHQHHHSTNGNWDRYRGPLNVIPVEEYAALSDPQQRRYRNARSIWWVPVAGFVYLLLNPRVTLLKGSFCFMRHLIKAKSAEPRISMRAHASAFRTRYWSSRREYWHMFWNSTVLAGLWGLMAWLVGPVLFAVCYIASVSLAGGAGILLFTVQHNFENSYASRDEGWDRDRAALEGTSFLDLPDWLGWFTANIAYHHVHHMSARIPAYRLIACHDENRQLFSGVTRITLAQVPRAFRNILWDTRSRCIISVARYQEQQARGIACPSV